MYLFIKFIFLLSVTAYGIFCLWVGIPRSKRLSKLFSDMSSKNPKMISKCSVYTNGQCLGGVASLLGGHLVVVNADEQKYEIPVKDIQITKIPFRFKMWNIMFEKIYGIHMPGTKHFALGFFRKKAQLWKEALSL